MVEGTIENGIIVYKGIPFAAPPIGDLRWQPPQPVIPWTGILKADKFAPSAPQTVPAILGYTDYGTSEDCLYLNIWQPVIHSGEKLPVMVWIHGGGFSIGSATQALTTGEELAKKGVIVVSIAYRLGALGFLSHPELSAESAYQSSGNYGLLDQIAGLKWVKENISGFGGDPNNISIFGLSAGGQSVSILAASPLAKGLFNKIICMSGGSFAPVTEDKTTGFMQLSKCAEKSGIEFCKRMGVESIDDLRKIDIKKILNDSASTLGGFWPVVDSYVIADDQAILYEAGQYSDVPVLIGNTSDEGSLFVMKAKTRDYITSTKKTYGVYADRLLNVYPKGEKDETKAAMAELFRDAYFLWHSYKWASLQTKTGTAPVYVYYFDQTQPPSFLTKLLKSNGAYHGSDCAYVFKHLEQKPKPVYSEEDKKLSEMMATYWTNFAKFGDPNGESLPVWPVYKNGEPTVLYLDSNIRTGAFPNEEKIKLLDAYYQSKR
jgi:para-nitrobenzyl esterase